MGTESEGVEVGVCVVKHVTDKALLVRFEDGREDWVPKSQIHDDSEVFQANQEGKMVVTAWYAKQKGWAE